MAVARSEPWPDLILLDVVMPEVDGYAVFDRLRSDPRTAHIPVIFVTGAEGPDDERHGLAIGAVDFVTKPLRPSTILARVHTQLELKRARDVLRNQNCVLETLVAERMAENLVIQDVAIRALARLAEIRVLETGNHLLRTKEYVRAVAVRLSDHPRFAEHLSPTSIALLAKSAVLHDIGKVGIPDHILCKPGSSPRRSSRSSRPMRNSAAMPSNWPSATRLARCRS